MGIPVDTGAPRRLELSAERLEMVVDLKERSYEIKIVRGLLPRTGEIIRRNFGIRKVAVITDDTVNSLYGQVLLFSLQQAGFLCKMIVVPHGEQSKCSAVLNYVYGELAEFGLSRSDLVLTFGGGVVGDLGGFAAATFLRGIDYVQIPTTLLAQVDSSVGGKVAIDLPQGKNLVGAFHQPELVLIDPEVLDTLSPRVLHDGMAEVIKYGCIRDGDFFAYLEQIGNDGELLKGAEKIIGTSCGIKADLVSRDEFDRGERMLLNFGHTLGHSIEKAGGYEQYTHGEAVGMGMLAVTRATERLGLTRSGTADRIAGLLEKFALPCSCEYSSEELLETMHLDKKRQGGEITLVVLEALGKSRLLQVALDSLDKYFVI